MNHVSFPWGSSFVRCSFRGVATVLLWAGAVSLSMNPVSAQEVNVLDPASVIMENHLRTLPNYRAQWLKATTAERQRLAEQIGEAGARLVCERQGWTCEMDGGFKAVRQGFDQVWSAGDQVYVVEAKGGTSTLGTGYGYPQGSPEWAVEAAKKTLTSHQTSEAEKRAARLVLKAAAEKKLAVCIIQTEHMLGEPMKPKFKKVAATSDKAMEMAREAYKEFSIQSAFRAKPGKGRSVLEPFSASDETVFAKTRSMKHSVIGASETVCAEAKAAGKSAQTAAKTGKALGGTVKAVGKIAGPAAAAADIGMRGYEAYETEQKFKNGEITRQERNKAHVKNGAEMAGGGAGAWAGMTAGSAAGAVAGSVVPGPGTAIGGFVGGLAGGIGGYFGGSKAADATVDYLME